MYPIAYSAEYEGQDRNRVTVFFRAIIAIPWFFVLALYGVVAFFAVVAAWFALVFTGRYPTGLYEFNAGVLRMSARVGSFSALLTDQFPSWGTGDDVDYPIRTLVESPKDRYDRLKVLLRLLLLIPVHILAYVMQVILQVVGFVAWLVIIFTGEFPIGLYRPMRIAEAYVVKAGAYGMLLTEDFPPFWQDEEEEAARFGRDSPSAATEPTTSLGL